MTLCNMASGRVHRRGVARKMSVLTQEAPSVDITELKKQVLLEIIRHEFNYLFYRKEIDREVVIGTIGDRGGGKSATDAVLGFVNFMLDGKSVWSNMEISLAIEISDDTAREHGLNSGGWIEYRSEPLEKNALLRLDDKYRGGCLVIEEINVQYSNVRRFMSNTNVDFNEVCQQLRKFKTSLIYNVIDEMFIDSQLRSLTDFFIKTYDTAFDVHNLEKGKKTGLDFNWTLYPMSGYLAGEQNKYARTKQSIKNVMFNFTPWHGIFDSWHHQEKGIYTEARSSKDMEEHFDKWGWLANKAILLKKKHITSMEPWELTSFLGKPINNKEIRDMLNVYGIHYDRYSQQYKIENFDLGRESQLNEV